MAVVLLVTVAVVVLGGAVSAGERPRGAFGWPLAGPPRVDRPFVPPRTAYGPGHRGVDLRGRPGATVRSAGPGWVAYAGLLAGRGVVSVRHAGGLRTTYEPVEAAVAVGQPVSRGTPIGTLSGGHRSCRLGTTCLHWGLLRGQAYLDPLTLVAPTELRLLPLGSGPGLAESPGRGGASVVGGVVPAPPPAAAHEPGGRWGATPSPATVVGASAVGLSLGAAAGALLGGRARRRQDARGRGP